MENVYDKAVEAADFLRSKLPRTPDVLVVLGSGLGVFAESLESPLRVDYKEIPHLPASTVIGHHGRQICGFTSGKFVAAMQGRFHFYEGYSMQEATFYLRVAKLLGIEKIILTNSAGGLDPTYSAGDIMLIEDHLNFMHANPLRGHNDERFGPRFPDMTEVYDREFKRFAREEAEKLGLNLRAGVYAGLLGPSYETPAEIRMLRTLGADAVGMSTVPEAIVARHMGQRVLGFSCISNLAAGILDQPINHEEVLETGTRIAESFVALLQRVIARM